MRVKKKFTSTLLTIERDDENLRKSLAPIKPIHEDGRGH